jgi:prepilin-type N-terminal cleavage/methylation domain-containing protein/prepilin-type processing-associated H-X9-DG protein
MHRSDAASTYRNAFTLIELLVVIAIIAILIGVLLPALASARDSAKSLLCTTRMRQVATGWQIYADTNRDISVPAQPGRFDNESLNVYQLGNGDQYRPRWFAVIGAAAGFDAFANPSPDRVDEHTMSVDANEVFLCPVVPEWTNTRNYAFGYNHHFLGNTRFVNDDELSGFINFPVRASSLSSSNTVMFADSLGTAAGKPVGEHTQNRNDGSRDPQLLAQGGHGYALDPPRMLENNDFADRRNRSFEHRSAPHARHRGKTNAAFCDGHVETLTLEELGYVVEADGSVPADRAEASNARFSGTNRDDDPPILSR